MPLPAVAAVGRTALMTAAARETESRRPDRLFADPWAGALLDAYRGAASSPDSLAGRSGRSELWDFLDLYFACRTPFFDAHVHAGVAAGARQVVILAAGLDARAARLDLPPGTTVYEVDAGPVLEFKGQALADAGLDVGHRVPVVTDLAGDWPAALRTAGHRADEPTVWLAEGLLMYLDGPACTRLAGAVRAASAPGSRLAVEYLDRHPVHADITEMDDADRQLMDTVLPLFDDGPPAPPRPWLTAAGVTVDRVTDVAAEITGQGREVPPIIDPARPDPLTIHLASGTLG